MSRSRVESLHSRLQAALINDLLCALYSDGLSRRTFLPNFPPSSLAQALSGGRSRSLCSFHKDKITPTQMHLNVNADTNNKCTGMALNTATQYRFAWFINSWSVIGLFLFIHSLYNQADVCRAHHNHVYEK